MSNSRYLQEVVNRDLLTGSGDPDHVYVDINIIVTLVISFIIIIVVLLY